MPSLKSIKISYSSPPPPSSCPCNSLPPPPPPPLPPTPPCDEPPPPPSLPPTPPCDEPPPPPSLPPPPPPSPHPPCSPCQHKNNHPPPPGAAPSPPPPPPPPVAAPPPPPPPPVAAPPPSPKVEPNIIPLTSPSPWLYPAIAPSPYSAAPPGNHTALVVGTSLGGLFFLSLLALFLNFVAKKMVIRKPVLQEGTSSPPPPPPPQSAPGGGNPDLPGIGVNEAALAASASGDVEKQEALVPPHDKGKQIAPPSTEDPTSQKESEDREKDDKSKSSEGVIKMLKEMKYTLLLMKEFELMTANHNTKEKRPDQAKAERPTTSSAAEAKEESDVLEEEETAVDDDAEAEQKTGESDDLPENKEEKTLEDSVAAVEGRPVAKNMKSRKRDSNRLAKQGEATSATLVKSGVFMKKANNESDAVEEEETTVDDDVEEQDSNFEQESEAEQKTGESDDLPGNKEEKTLEDSVAAVKERPVAKKRDSNRSTKQGEATSAALNDVVKSGVFMEKATMVHDDEDNNQNEGRDEEENALGQVTRSVEEKNIPKNSESLLKRNDGSKRAGGPKKHELNRSPNTQLQQANAKRSSVNMASAQQKMVKPLVNDLTKSSDKLEGQEIVPDGDDDAANIEDEQSPQLGDVQALGGIDPLEGIELGLGFENWNEVKRLVVETSGLLQDFMKKNKGMRRHIVTSKAMSAASEFDEQDDDDDVGEDEFQSSPQETDEKEEMRSAENYGSLLKGKNVVKKAVNKNIKTGRSDLNRSAKTPERPRTSTAPDVGLKSDELEEPEEVVDEDVMEENQNFQKESEQDLKSPVKYQSLLERNNEPKNTMLPVFSTPVSKNMKPGKAHLQHVGEEKKTMSSITDVVKSSGESQEQEIVKDDDAEEEEQEMEKDDDAGEEDPNFPQESEQEQEMVNDDDNAEEEHGNLARESEKEQKAADESEGIRFAEEMDPVKGQVAINIKAGRRDLNRSAKTQSYIAEAERPGTSSAPDRKSDELEEPEEVIDEGVMEENQNFLQESEQEQEMVKDDDAGEEYHDFQQESEQEQKTVKDDDNAEEEDGNLARESEKEQKAMDESEGVKGNDKHKRPVPRNMKAGKLDLNRSTKTQFQQGKAKSSILNVVMESGVFEQQQEMVIGDDSVEEYQDLPQELGQEAKTDESSLQDYKNVLSLDESHVMTGNYKHKRPVAINIKARKLDLNSSAKTQSHLAEAKRKKTGSSPHVVQESSEFEDQKEVIDENVMEEAQESEVDESCLGAEKEGNDEPKRPVSKKMKERKHDLSGLAKAQLVNDDAEEEYLNLPQESGQEQKANDIMEVAAGNDDEGISQFIYAKEHDMIADDDALSEVKELLHVEKVVGGKAGKRDLNQIQQGKTNRPTTSSTLNEQDMVIGDHSVEEYQNYYESLLKGGDERTREMAVGKRHSPKTQLKQPKAERPTLSSALNVVKESGEFLEQEMTNDDGEGEYQNLDESFLQEYKNTESQVMRPVESKRTVAPKKHHLSKTQLHLQAKAKRPTTSSVGSAAFKEKINQELLPDADADDVDADDVEVEEEEEEESATTEEVSQSSSV